MKKRRSEMESKLCQVVSDRCTRPAQVEWQLPTGNVDICLTHYRIFTIGEFGEKENPPWTPERALSALINQDGLDPEVASKRVNKHFGVGGTP
jgi:hypothetical protein